MLQNTLSRFVAHSLYCVLVQFGVHTATLKLEPSSGRQAWAQEWKHKPARQVIQMIQPEIAAPKMKIPEEFVGGKIGKQNDRIDNQKG